MSPNTTAHSLMKLIIVSLIIFLSISNVIAAGGEDSLLRDDKQNVKGPPTQDDPGIKAGYIKYDMSPIVLPKYEEWGINTIFLKSYRFNYPTYVDLVVEGISDWARRIKTIDDMKLFVVINWQPYPKSQGLWFDGVICDDGTMAIPADPFNPDFMEGRVFHIINLITELSLDPELQIDGIILDMEIYGTGGEPVDRRSYTEYASGYGDYSFIKYLFDQGYDPVPDIAAEDRKAWLDSNGLLDDYFSYLREYIEAQAEYIREAVHEVNRDITFGIYPHPEKSDWVRYSMAKGLSSNKFPILVLGTHSYGYYLDANGDGFPFIPEDVEQEYRDDKIESNYLCGYLFRMYTGESLYRGLLHALLNYDGYWMFYMPQLTDEFTDTGGYYLIDSQVNLIQAIIDANEYQMVP